MGPPVSVEEGGSFLWEGVERCKSKNIYFHQSYSALDTWPQSDPVLSGKEDCMNEFCLCNHLWAHHMNMGGKYSPSPFLTYEHTSQNTGTQLNSPNLGQSEYREFLKLAFFKKAVSMALFFLSQNQQQSFLLSTFQKILPSSWAPCCSLHLTAGEKKCPFLLTAVTPLFVCFLRQVTLRWFWWPHIFSNNFVACVLIPSSQSAC